MSKADNDFNFRSIAHSAPDAILIVNSSGKICSWNLGAEKVFGYSESEAIGQNLSFIIPERFRMHHEMGMKKAFDSDSNRPKVVGKTIELMGLRKDGSEFPIELSLSTWRSSKDRFFSGIIRDLSDRKKHIEELQAARMKAEQERYFSESIARLLPNHIYVFDILTSEIIYSNHQLLPKLGYSEKHQENYYDFLLSLAHPDDQNFLKSYHQRSSFSTENEIQEFKVRYQHINQSWKWFLHRERVFKWNEDRTPRQIIGISQDITELHQAQESLKSAHEDLEKKIEIRNADLKLVNESIPHIVWQVSGDGDNITLNRQWDLYTGQRSDLKAWDLVIHPDDIQLARSIWQSCLKSGQPYSAEYRMKSKSGVYRWFQARGVAQKDTKGQIIKWYGTCTDVHDQKTSHENLKKALKDLSDVRFALDQSAIIATTDSTGCITYVNDRFCEISKYSREELIGKTHRIINSGYHPKDFFQDLWKTILEGKIWRGEVCNRAKDGSLYWVDTVIIPFMGEDNKPYQFTAIRYDICERKKNEVEKASLLAKEQAALEASRLKSEFLANMSHEIRTPINGVIGLTGLLLDTPLSQEQKNYIDSIKLSGEGLLTIVNDILDFSKIEANRIDFEFIEFNFIDAILEAQKTLAHAAASKGIDFRIELPGYLPNTVIGDPGRLKQILLNLLSNAIKFTYQGHVVIRINLRNVTEKSALIRFEIEDTGIGIPQEALSRMFEAFSQVDASTQRRFGGTGLGLSICKKLVEKMNGSIGVTSELNLGSMFWFEINFPFGNSQARANSKDQSSRSFSQEKKVRILVVEDNQINQMITRKMLEKMGHYTDVAGNGIEALKALDEKPYDLVIMDCQMPEMDGYEATQKIRSLENALYSNIPILAMTANAMKGDAEKCLASGMSDYVSKPVSFQKLESVLNYWLSQIRPA